jgi:hypothetical protein
MSDVDVDVDPNALRQAAEGINGVISKLSGGVMGSYTGQLGRGFDDLALTGEQMSHPDAKAGMDNFVQRWEWGTRALVSKASDIGHALHMGAGMIEKQDQYFNNAGKGMVNDLVGDPSLQSQTTYNPDGSVAAVGTDDMSWGQMVNHNLNQLAHPDWSAQSFRDALPQLQNSWNVVQQNAGQAVENLTVPGAAGVSTVQGFLAPAPPAPAPAGPPRA